MNGQLFHLEIQCSNPDCKGCNYYEDETGYYVCADCNTISQIRCGLELDYTYPIRSSKLISKKNEDDEILSDDGMVNENNNEFDLISQKYTHDGGETILNFSTTNIKSSRYEASSFNDISSVYSKSKKGKILKSEKTTQEKLTEIQGYFVNIVNIIINDFFENKNNNLRYEYLIKLF